MIPKFRLFDKELKIMREVHLLDMYAGIIQCYVDDFKTNQQEIYEYDMDEIPLRYELMQSTGLKDKNGVEIYYNDIVKRDNGEIIVIDDIRTHAFLDLFLHSGFEVIGNVHENADLLE